MATLVFNELIFLLLGLDLWLWCYDCSLLKLFQVSEPNVSSELAFSPWEMFLFQFPLTFLLVKREGVFFHHNSLWLFVLLLGWVLSSYGNCVHGPWEKVFLEEYFNYCCWIFWLDLSWNWFIYIHVYISIYISMFFTCFCCCHCLQKFFTKFRQAKFRQTANIGFLSSWVCVICLC